MRGWELDSIAASLETVMPDLCDVYRRTGNRDRFGGGHEFVPVLESVKVGIAPTDFFQYQRPVAAETLADITYYSMAFPRGTTVKEGDLIDVFTIGVKVSAMQIERGESWDTMVRVYGQEIESEGWFELNRHGSLHS